MWRQPIDDPVASFAQCVATVIALLIAGFVPVSVSTAQDSVAPLELSGVSESESYDITDLTPLDPDESMMQRMLYRAKKTSLANFYRFGGFSSGVSYPQLIADPQKYRLWVFRISGRVQSLRWKRLEKAVDGAPISGVYIATLRPDGMDRAQGETAAVTVVARSVPAAWINAIGKKKLQSGSPQPLNQSSACYGFFYKMISPEKQQAPEGTAEEPDVPVFVADRLQWFPFQSGGAQAIDHALGVGPADAVLAYCGFDASLFDEVKPRNHLPFSYADIEPFYQLIKASTKLDRKAYVAAPAKEFLDLVRNPQDCFGDLVEVTGRVRRCIEVEIDNPDVRKRIGLDRYYELDMFVPIDARISIKTRSGESLIYENRFPMTVCLARLPRGFKIEELKRQTFEVKGFFYRFWKYGSEFTAESGEGQICPLLVGVDPVHIPRTTSFFDNILKYGTLTIFGAGIWMFWYFRTSDRSENARRVTNVTPREDLPERIEINLDGNSLSEELAGLQAGAAEHVVPDPEPDLTQIEVDDAADVDEGLIDTGEEPPA